MILACYPATGKSYAKNKYSNAFEYRYDYPRKELLKSDLNESELAELLEYEIKRAQEIIEFNKQHDYVFIQTDFRLLQGLDQLHQEYTIVIPNYHLIDMKEHYEQRYLRRGVLSTNFINTFINNWDTMMKKLDINKNNKIYLDKDEYVSDIIERLEKKK